MTEAFDVPLATLATLPRRELSADFHCVAGWSATNLRWEGVSFEIFYRSIITPALPSDTVVTHVVFGGLDGYRSVVSIEDALADGVLIAECLDDRPLDGDHGAPARVVSPTQYGYVSTKHLCRVEVHTAEARDAHASPISNLLFKRHPRARVWEQRPGSHPAATMTGACSRRRSAAGLLVMGVAAALRILTERPRPASGALAGTTEWCLGRSGLGREMQGSFLASIRHRLDRGSS